MQKWLKGRDSVMPWIAGMEGYVYLLPGYLIFLAFIIMPIIQAFRLSFYNWKGIANLPETFIGLKNYINFSQDSQALTAISHNFYYIIFLSILPVVIGLFFTFIITRNRVRGISTFRAIMFLPQIFAAVAIGVAWRWIFNPLYGPINVVLKNFGLGDYAQPWLGISNYATLITGLVGTWITFGFCIMLFVAGAEHINTELYDAAMVDGANSFQQFWVVTLPGLRNEIEIALTVTIIGAIRFFGVIVTLTGGGPGNSTNVIIYYLFNYVFRNFRVGYAAAISVVLTILIIVLSRLSRLAIRLFVGKE